RERGPPARRRRRRRGRLGSPPPRGAAPPCDGAHPEGGGPGGPLRARPAAAPRPPGTGGRRRRGRLRGPGAPRPRVAGPHGGEHDDLAARGAPIRPRRGRARGRTIGVMSTDESTLPAPAPSVWPSVGFTDVDAGVRVLTEVLGFVVTALYRDDDGTVAHAEARWPDGGGVMFGSRGKPGDWGALGPTGVYVVAAEAATVDAAWARARDDADLEV